MGFLDRMVSDLIYKNTGFKTHRLVRKIGGGKLLVAGAGAVLAAALSEQQQDPRASDPAVATQPPPPPSVPSAGASPSVASSLPPPPPPAEPPLAASPDVDSGPIATPAGNNEELPPEQAYVVVRTLVAAAMADGRLMDEEREVIDRHLGESSLSSDEQAQIHRDMALPPTPSELAEQAIDPELRQTLYRLAVLVIRADRQVSELEKSWLARFARACELSEARRQELETEVFST